MADTVMTHGGPVQARPEGWQGVAADWSSDQRAFKNVPWGKAMMWIFLLSDTFIFGCFLLSYMTARSSTRPPWAIQRRSPAMPTCCSVSKSTVWHRDTGTTRLAAGDR